MKRGWVGAFRKITNGVRLNCVCSKVYFIIKATYFVTEKEEKIIAAKLLIAIIGFVLLLTGFCSFVFYFNRLRVLAGFLVFGFFKWKRLSAKDADFTLPFTLAVS